MTERKIQFALKRITSSREKGYYPEALIRTYHLNLEILRYILNTCVENYPAKDKKVKALVGDLVHETERNATLHTIISKKNVKAIKPWLDKMEVFFKALKHKLPANSRALQLEGEKIAGLLNISVNKLFSRI